MTTLAFDCSTGHLSVALVDSGSVLARLHRSPQIGAAEDLVPAIAAVLDEARLGIDACARIGVTVGPGHFTGLRIGLAAARGFGLATGAPVIGVSTLEVLAVAAAKDNDAGLPLLAAVDSRRAEPYFQRFDADGRALGEAVATLPEIFARGVRARATMLCGDRRIAPLLRAAGIAVQLHAEYPDAVALAGIAAARPAGLPLRPFYLQPTHDAVAP
jgi:tRNA threonylcarbamoyladenosine biosynthesis protein TsaB